MPLLAYYATVATSVAPTPERMFIASCLVTTSTLVARLGEGALTAQPVAESALGMVINGAAAVAAYAVGHALEAFQHATSMESLMLPSRRPLQLPVRLRRPSRCLRIAMGGTRRHRRDAISRRPGSRPFSSPPAGAALASPTCSWSAPRHWPSLHWERSLRLDGLDGALGRSFSTCRGRRRRRRKGTALALGPARGRHYNSTGAALAMIFALLTRLRTTRRREVCRQLSLFYHMPLLKV